MHIKDATNIYIPNYIPKKTSKETSKETSKKTSKKTSKETSKEPSNNIIENTYSIIQNAESIYIDIIFDYYLDKIEKAKKYTYIDICNQLFSIDYYKKIDIFYIGVLMIQMNRIMGKMLFKNEDIIKCMCIEDPKRRISHEDLIREIGKYSNNPLMQHMRGSAKSGGFTTKNLGKNLGKILEKSDTNIKKNIMPLKSKIPINVSKSKSSFEIPIEEISVSTTREFSLKLLNSINKEIN
jgi:hypothetical protein